MLFLSTELIMSIVGKIYLNYEQVAVFAKRKPDFSRFYFRVNL